MARSLLSSAALAVAMLSLARFGFAQENIPWTADLRQAQAAAARDGKLVLLHFYSDNCPPCKAMERNVFSRADVATAIHRNYVPVKVHVDTMPRVAERYQVDRWPTDVFVTPAGLEVFRTVSKQSPEQYLTLLDQVAFQAGVGAGRQPGDRLLDTGALNARRSDVSLTAATVPMGQSSNWDAAGPAAGSTAPGYANPLDQGLGANSTAPSSSLANPYVIHEPTGPRYSGPSYAQQQQVAAAPRAQAPRLPATQPPPATQRWPGQAGVQNPIQPSLPAGQSIYGDVPDQAAAAATPPYGPQQRQSFAPNQGQQPQPATSIYDHAATPPAPPQRQVRQPAAPPAAAARRTSAEVHAPRFVDVSKAPPLSLDGFCPVTIQKTQRWHKGDVRFGAVHRGRTYLFASAEAQREFLADPERYAPTFSGCDPVVLAETNQFVSGNYNIGLLIAGKTYFFASEETRERFKLSPEAYLGPAHQAYAAQLRTR